MKAKDLAPLHDAFRDFLDACYNEDWEPDGRNFPGHCHKDPPWWDDYDTAIQPVLCEMCAAWGRMLDAYDAALPSVEDVQGILR